MTQASLSINLYEHTALSAMPRPTPLLLCGLRRRGTQPDFSVLCVMLFCCDELLEKLHHSKESRLLFPNLHGHGTHSDAGPNRFQNGDAPPVHALLPEAHADRISAMNSSFVSAIAGQGRA